jgi:hypothetical protein
LRELVGDRVMEALPALQNIILGLPGGLRARASDIPMIGFEPFVAARQLSGRPVAVHFSE